MSLVRPITRNDIRGPKIWAGIRDDMRKRIIEIKKARRLILGDLVSMVFENRHTLTVQIEEICRVENLTTDEQINSEIAVYNSLMPTAHSLAATLFVELAPDDRAGSLHSELSIKNRRIATDDLTLDLARVPIVLQGWTDFDGRIDYRLRSDRFVDRLSPRAREWLAELSGRLEGAADVRIQGTIDDQQISVDGLVLTSDAGGSAPGAERVKLRDVARRLRNHIRR